ncbi:Ig-like domain-containing protein [Cytophagaceae bacterium ABcell3]|nr:Ig-like domain-containing protein [Cytophagaceae bacterium ABcell3]
MINNYRSKAINRLLLSMVFLLSTFLVKAQTPVDLNGKLKLVGNQLSSECGNPVQLRGMSTHGPQWYGHCVTEEALDVMQNDWNASIFRLAMYVESGGYLEDPEYWRNWIDRWVDETGKRGMYCMIDWHILSDGNPLTNLEPAKEFWEYMSSKHAGKDHVLYEICNEPNGPGGSWENTKAYAEEIIPIIRANDPETVIMVGTPNWSGTPWDVLGNELEGDLAHNVMYSFHFYAGTHGDRLGDLTNTLSQIPIFATEWGVSAASGDGGFNEEVTNAYMDVFNGNNPDGVTVSWCNWSWTHKDETSAALSPGSCDNNDYSNLTASGELVQRHMKNPEDNFIPCSPEPNIHTQPSAQIVRIGETATFSVSASGESLSYQWRKDGEDISGATNSTLTIENVSESDLGSYTVVVSNSYDTIESEAAQLREWQEGPYHGTPTLLPGRVQAQDYDIGGQDVSYYDNTEGNQGGAYRDDDVDIERTLDSEGGYHVGWIEEGEWLTYTVEVEKSGIYNFSFRLASDFSDRNFTVSFDDEEAFSVDVPNTGGWQQFETVTVEGVELSAGTQVLRLDMTSSGFNLNYFDAELVEENDEDPINVAPEVAITGPENNAAFDAGDNITITADASDSDGEVVLVEFFNGDEKLGETSSAPYSFTWENVEEGTYTLTAVAHDNDGASTTSDEVTVVVNRVNVAPEVAIVSPEDNAEFEAGTNIEITAEASDSDGEVVLAEFFSNGDKIGEADAEPFTVTWEGVEEGGFELTAVAHDNDGAETTSDVIYVVVNAAPVNEAPEVSITSPEEGAMFALGDDIVITAEASDSDGYVDYVEFYNGNERLGVVQNAPFVYTWSNAPAGMYNLIAIAYDNDGASTDSEPVAISVVADGGGNDDDDDDDDPEEPENIAPEVSIVSPASGDEFTEGDDITVEVNATDEDGEVVLVELFNGDELVAELTEAPFVFTLENVEEGTYTLAAVAHDNDGDYTTSDAVTVSVVAEEEEPEPENVAPEVSIVSPASGDEFTEGDDVTVEVNATDEDGEVVLVELFNGDELVAELTEAPFVFTLENVEEGTYTLTAVAHDNDGAYTTSDAVAISVIAEEEEDDDENIAPEVAITSPVSGDEFMAGDTVTVEINATDEDGEVVRVELFNGDELVAELTEEPFVYTWYSIEEGDYVLTAVAYDNEDASTTSEEVAFSVVAEEDEEDPAVRPEVAIVSPEHDHEVEAGSPLVIEAEASVSGGAIDRVEFFYGDRLIGVAYDAPYSVTWERVPAGRHGLTAVAYDMDSVSTVSADIWIDGVQTLEEGPYGGIAHVIPGTIEAQDYDLGGNGVGYYDLSEGNQGGAYRNDDVDIGFNPETNIYSVGWVEDGEWLNYTVNVESSGVYDFYFSVSTDQDDTRFGILLNDETLIESVTIPNTGGWNNWERVRVRGVELEAGEHVLQFLVQSSAFNFNYIEVKDGSDTEPNIAPEVSLTRPSDDAVFNPDVNINLQAEASDSDGYVSRVLFMVDGEEVGETTEEPYTFTWENVPAGVYEITAVAIDNESASTTSEAVTITVLEEATSLPFGGSAHLIPGRIEAEDYDEGGQGVSYYDGTEGNQGGAYRNDNVDIGYNPENDITSVGWIEDGEWLNYTVNVDSAGLYDFTFNVATEFEGRGFAVSMDGEEVISNAVVPNTSGWNNWTTMTIRGVELEAGEQVMQIYMHGGEFNLDYIQITDGSETLPNIPPTVSIVRPSGSATFNPGSTVEVEAEALDVDGFIFNVEFFVDGDRVGVADAEPYVFTIEDLEPGTYEVTARARDNEGATTTSEAVTIEIRESPVSLPFGGVAHTIPGVIEAQDYDEGGQEVAYYDRSRGNMGGAYRQDNVDIGFNAETGIYSVGWTEDMEWLNYTVNVDSSGVYDFIFRVATPVSGMALAIDMDDNIIIDRVEVPNTGDWNAWDEVIVRGVELTEGEQVMRLTFIGGDVNINNMEVVPSDGTVDDDDDEDPIDEDPTDPTDPSECVLNETPSESDWIVRNDWSDQYSGSFVSNDGDELLFTQRAWGRQYAWLIETGKSFSVEEGEEFTITFDARTGDNVPATSVQVGLALGAMWDRPDLLQAAYEVKESVTGEYATYSVTFVADKSGEVNLALRFDWGAQQNSQVEIGLRNVEICGAGGYEKMAKVSVEEDIDVYPNPVVDVAKADIKSDAEVTVVSMNGQVVYGPVQHNGMSLLDIDLSQVPTGIYILSAKTSDGVKTKKLIKR